MRFSDRIGAQPALQIQIDRMSTDLRNSLWNVVHIYYFEDTPSWDTELRTIAKLGHISFFKLPVDELPEYLFQYRDWIKKWISGSKWFEVYDYIEWLGSHGDFWENWKKGNDAFEKAQRFRKSVNGVLERESSGYRFVDSQITPITSSEEILEVERAASRTGQSDAVGAHIRSSIALFSDRTSPDYRNAIKEAISAVEAATRVVSGDPKATLGDGLRWLDKKGELHPALKNGFSSIYGYTSDADGIRHAMMEIPDLKQEDARFMLIICSAFANYLLDRLGNNRS